MNFADIITGSFQLVDHDDNWHDIKTGRITRISTAGDIEYTHDICHP